MQVEITVKVEPTGLIAQGSTELTVTAENMNEIVNDLTEAFRQALQQVLTASLTAQVEIAEEDEAEEVQTVH